MTTARKSNAQSQIPTGVQDTPYIDTTKLIQGVLLRMSEGRSGSIADATGAAMDVALDFDPAVVILIDETQDTVAIKLPGQATDTACTIQHGAQVAAEAATITLGEGKFTIGTNAKVNTLHDVVRWLAFGFSALGGQ